MVKIVQRYLKKMNDYIDSFLHKEKHQLILWIPVLFGLGTTIYFGLNTEPEINKSMGLSALFGTLIILSRQHKKLILLLLVALLVSGGFAVAKLRAQQVQAPVIADEWKRAYSIEAIVEKIETQSRGVRIWFSDVAIDKVETAWTPKYIRISVNTNIDGVRAGDKVWLRAILYPPPRPAMPGAYDFARQAYFQQIGAVGYSVSKVKVLNKSEKFDFYTWVADIRHSIAERIRVNSIGEDEGAISAALLVGDRGAIKKRVVEQMRDAGLAHLLAISGLHLALVATICFFSVRLLLALSAFLTLRYPIKRYAALSAIVFSFFYLLITGAPISAERAFIMTGLVLLSVVLNRSVTPLRSIALAAFIVLLFTPESILSPSFQMSFAAAGALIAAFEFLRKYMAGLLQDAGLMRRLSVYLIGTLLSSLVAGLATAPFALYHFSHMSSYSLLANLVAVPLTSLWIMPWGVLVFLLLPFGLESIALYPMGWGIDVVLNVAEYVSALPQATPAVQALPITSLALITIAMLWLALWKTRIRVFGVVLLIPAIYLAAIQPIPDILVDENGKMLAFLNDNEIYEFPAATTPRFVKESWMERLGQADNIKLKDGESSANIKNEGDRNFVYSKDGLKILFAHDKPYANLRCDEADYLVDMYWYEIMHCPNIPTLFNRQDLDLDGTHVVYLQEGELPRVENVRAHRGDRPW